MDFFNETSKDVVSFFTGTNETTSIHISFSYIKAHQNKRVTTKK